MKKLALIISTNERAEQLLPVFYPVLSKNFEVKIFCPVSVQDYICRNHPGNQYSFFNFSSDSSFLVTLIFHLRTHTLVDYNLTPAIAWHVKRILKTGGFYIKFISLFCSILKKIKLFRDSTFWDKVELIFIDNGNLEKEFRAGNYHLVLFPNPVLTESELRVFWAAKRRELKVVTLDEAFSEFTTKFHSFRPIDKILVWNNESAEEARKFHKIEPAKFEVVGPVRFDYYYRQDLFPSRKEFYEHLNLEEGDRLITFTLNRFPVNKTVVKIVSQAVLDGALPPCTKFLIRFIPKDTRDVSPERIENLKRQFLEVGDPEILRFDIPQDSDFCKKNLKNTNLIGLDILHLGSVLKFSDAVLCINSTVIVEAHIFNTPAFYIGFTVEQDQLRKAEYVDFGYIPKVSKCDNNLAIFTADQLIDILNRALKINKNAPIWQTECDNFVRVFMTYNDGKTSERIISHLKTYV